MHGQDNTDSARSPCTRGDASVGRRLNLMPGTNQLARGDGRRPERAGDRRSPKSGFVDSSIGRSRSRKDRAAPGRQQGVDETPFVGRLRICLVDGSKGAPPMSRGANSARALRMVRPGRGTVFGRLQGWAATHARRLRPRLNALAREMPLVISADDPRRPTASRSRKRRFPAFPSLRGRGFRYDTLALPLAEGRGASACSRRSRARGS